MSNSALSFRQLVAVFQRPGADNVSSCTQSHSLTSPLCPQEGSLCLNDPLYVGDRNKVLYCSAYDKLIRRPNCVLVLIALHLFIVGFQGCNHIFVQEEAVVRWGIWSEQMIYGTLAPQFCVIVLRDGNMVPPPSCLLSSLSTIGHKSQLNFESGFYLHLRWYSEAQAVPRNSFYCTCGIHSSQIRPESNFSPDALIAQSSGIRSLWHFRFVVMQFDDT